MLEKKFYLVSYLLTKSTLKVYLHTQTGTNSCNFGSKDCCSTEKGVVFWTCSKVVKCYIQNTIKVFAVNWIHQIKSNSGFAMYILTKENPADECFRGLNMRWSHGPGFIWIPAIIWHNGGSECSIDGDDVEVKMTNNVTRIKNVLSTLESKFSSWKKVKRIMRYILFFIFRKWRKALGELEVNNQNVKKIC